MVQIVADRPTPCACGQRPQFPAFTEKVVVGNHKQDRSRLWIICPRHHIIVWCHILSNRFGYQLRMIQLRLKTRRLAINL